jgi:ribosomal protein S18 acetylase RimI-like enzyme
MKQFTVRPALSSEWNGTLELLFADDDDPRERAEEILASVDRGVISLENLLLAEESGKALGAGLFTIQAGGIAFVWPPGAKRGHSSSSEIRRTILSDTGQRLDRLEICFGQVILEPTQTAVRDDLNQTGFRHLTDLTYMLFAVGPRAGESVFPSLELETFEEANAERFVDVLARTYEGTLDCPELDGWRSPREALAAHRATGKFDPGLWWIVREEQRDAGLLLINEHPEEDLFEIVYVGVAPEFRGRGLGRRLIESARHEALRRSRSLVLAVDGRNRVARKIYQSLGFLDLSIQAVHIRPKQGRSFSSQSTAYAHAKASEKKIS